MTLSNPKKLSFAVSLRTLLRVSAAVLLFFVCLYGQAQTSTLTGSVRDNTGAAIPNATLSLKNAKTRAALVTTANGAGEYRYSALTPGDYSLRVEVPASRPSSATASPSASTPPAAST